MSADVASLPAASNRSDTPAPRPFATRGPFSAYALLDGVIRPTLAYLGVDTPQADRLLLGTMLVSQHLAERTPEGLGAFSITSGLHTELWDQHLARDPDLASRVRGLASQRCFLLDPHAELRYNLAYATAIAWCLYQYQHDRVETLLHSGALGAAWALCFPQAQGRAEDFYAAWRNAGLD